MCDSIILPAIAIARWRTKNTSLPPQLHQLPRSQESWEPPAARSSMAPMHAIPIAGGPQTPPWGPALDLIGLITVWANDKPTNAATPTSSPLCQWSSQTVDGTAKPSPHEMHWAGGRT
ncbi:hypothetical protein B0T18DRAFT_197363 [Schizothecium vesticola]|uniref:Uncharacterized protein n=1 Tax=Schizothecium vesticola TaxID=314040 RepID=A0AA40ERE1_9PEZI|nr:hypothetical protein B0T18DRAFT_197363 [Schizothecium vesticola]